MKEFMDHLPIRLSDADVKTVSPLVLAYLGDACFELYIRSRIIKDNPQFPPDRLHRLTVSFVRASSQSDIIHAIWDMLNEEEKSVVKRGRNAKSGTSPKSADVVQYRYATGFEAMVGYLLATGNTGRLLEILEMSYNQLDLI